MLDRDLSRRAAPADEVLAAAWCSSLGVPEARPGDNFFELGGDSITAIKLVAKLRAGGLALRLQDVLDHPTFADLASALDGRAVEVEAVKPAVAVPSTTADGSEPTGAVRRVPLVPVQARFLEDDRLAPDYHNTDAVLELPAGVTVAQVSDALSVLVRRHGVLAVRFDGTGAERTQEFGHPFDPATVLEVHEASPEDAETIERIGTVAQEGLSLADGRVFAARILTHDGTPWALALILHHLVGDMLSWSVIASELGYLLSGDAAALPPATAYADWAAYLADRTAAGAFDEHLAYWRARPWSAATGMRTLTEHPDRRLGGLRRHRSSVELGDAAAFRRLTVELGGNAIVVGAVNYALNAVYRARTTIVDVVVNGRDQILDGPDLSRTVGMLAEFAPVVTELGEATDPVAIVRATAAQMRAVPAPFIAFGALRELAAEPQVRQELRGLPAADIYVNYRGAPLGGETPGALNGLGYSLGPFQSPKEQQAYPVRLMVDLDGTVIKSLWKYSATELDEAEMEAVIEAFNRAIRELVAHC
ncbi:condensation domain-containing protein [Streptacidiphilus pinicola]|nr:condensation domain-containing protein [Streptacidiphilus pinicola]